MKIGTGSRPIEKETYDIGGLVLIGKAAVLKTAGFTPMGVRVPRPPRRLSEALNRKFCGEMVRHPDHEDRDGFTPMGVRVPRPPQ